MLCFVNVRKRVFWDLIYLSVLMLIVHVQWILFILKNGIYQVQGV